MTADATNDMLNPRWRTRGAAAKTDRRSRRTRSALSAALVTLLGKKPLKSITVTELTELADVNRATFYAHYQDIYDMFDQMKADLRQICQELADSHAAEISDGLYRPFIADVFNYFDENGDVLPVIMGERSGTPFFDEVADAIHRRCFDAARPLETARELDPDAARLIDERPELADAMCDYQFGYLVAGIVSMLRAWLEGGKREPIGVVVDQADGLTRSCGVKSFAANLANAQRTLEKTAAR